MEDFMSHGTAATMAFQRGDYRKAADEYLLSFQHCPDVGHYNRWHIWHGYSSILSEKYFPPTEADFEALAKVQHDKREPKIFRVDAADVSGFLHWWHKKDRVEAAEYYRDALDLASKCKATERRQKYMSTILNAQGQPTVGLKPAGEILDDTVKNIRHRLDELEKKAFQFGPDFLADAAARPVQMRSNGTPMPRDAHISRISIGPGGMGEMTKEQLDRLLTVGGNECDCCQKTMEELGISSLKKCSQCKKAFYCSPKCQKKQWKEHKHVCRKPGEIKPGDFLRIHSVVARPEMNGEVVKVVASAPNDRWEVRILGGNKSVSMAGDKLEQLRPLK